MTPDEYLTIGQAIRVIAVPYDKWARENKREIVDKLIKIMDKYAPEEEQI